MDLILWRHAEAIELPEGKLHDIAADMARELTTRGEKQAARMAAWLDRQLPESAKIWTSPAVRTLATVRALGRKYKILQTMGPLATPTDLLAASQWPDGKATVVLVGHQPCLGQLAAHLLGLKDTECSIKKGSIWWLRSRLREGVQQTLLVTVQSPEFV